MWHQARTLPQQVLDTDLAAVAVDAEIRYVIDDPVAPAEAALPDQDSSQSGGEGFGDRRNAKNGVLVDSVKARGVGVACCAQSDDSTSGSDDERGASDILVRYVLLEKIRESGYEAVFGDVGMQGRGWLPQASGGNCAYDNGQGSSAHP